MTYTDSLWGLSLHTWFRWPLFIRSFFPTVFSVAAWGDIFIKMYGSVCPGLRRSVLWTRMVSPSRCWLMTGFLVIKLGNSLLWATGVLSQADTAAWDSSWGHNRWTAGWEGRWFRLQLQDGAGVQQTSEWAGWHATVRDVDNYDELYNMWRKFTKK